MLLLIFLLLQCILLSSSSSLAIRKTIMMNNNEVSLVRSIRSLNSRLVDESLLNDAAKDMQISPPWNAHRWVWSLSWKLHQFMIPLLHYFDKCKCTDSFINLPVLWWKAIAGNRYGSKLYDNGVAFDLLPSFTRLIVAFPFCYLYPKLHHQNVALRTAFLDNALSKELKDVESANVIVLGAGYDTRSLRFLQKKNNKHDFFEFDFPSVIKSKTSMLTRFKLRRKTNIKIPTLFEADLNDLDLIKLQLKKLFSSVDSNRKVIFVVEAVLMYMKDENVAPLLDICVKEAQLHGSKHVSICFADRFPNVKQGNTDDEKEDVTQFFKKIGLQISEWRPKPGRARHMGIASTINE